MARPFGKLRGLPDRVLKGALVNNAQHILSLLRFRRAQQRGNILVTIWLVLLTAYVCYIGYAVHAWSVVMNNNLVVFGVR